LNLDYFFGVLKGRDEVLKLLLQWLKVCALLQFVIMIFYVGLGNPATSTGFNQPLE
jgi:hypothetical protein